MDRLIKVIYRNTEISHTSLYRYNSNYLSLSIHPEKSYFRLNNLNFNEILCSSASQHTKIQEIR